MCRDIDEAEIRARARRAIAIDLRHINYAYNRGGVAPEAEVYREEYERAARMFEWGEGPHDDDNASLRAALDSTEASLVAVLGELVRVREKLAVAELQLAIQETDLVA